MRVLALGGTRFVGRHLVNACLDRGDDVTVLHRGRTRSPFDGQLPHIRTDRRAPTPQAARALAGPWDAVLDTSARDAPDLRLVLPLLGEVGRYLLLSTCGVYRRAPGQEIPLTERSATILGGRIDAARASAAGKLRCERLLRRRLDRTCTPWLIARLGVVVGPHDHTGRLTYWLDRVTRGGVALVPMDAAQPLRLVDVRDVTGFLRHAIEYRLDGIANVAGPLITAETFIDNVFGQVGATAVPHWVSPDFLTAQRVQPWTDIPLWLPKSNLERALMFVSSTRAEAAGLTYRPLADTIADCSADDQGVSGWLDRQREQQLHDLWLEATR